MPSNKSKTRAVRVRNDIAEYIDRDSNNFREVIESLYEGVMAGAIEIRNNEVVIGKNSISLPEDVYRSLVDTLEIDEISAGEFVTAVMDAIDSGLIWLEDGKIVVDNAQ